MRYISTILRVKPAFIIIPSLEVKITADNCHAVKSAFTILCVRVGIITPGKKPTPMSSINKKYAYLIYFRKMLISVICPHHLFQLLARKK